MATPPSRVQWANIVAYHLLLSLVNLLNLPLPKGTFVPRRSMQLTVMSRDVERLRMLKRELDSEDPAAVRGFLVAAKALLFELEVALHQYPDLKPNPAFAADMERLATLVAQAAALDDAEAARDLAYKLSVMLPFYKGVSGAGPRPPSAGLATDTPMKEPRENPAWYPHPHARLPIPLASGTSP